MYTIYQYTTWKHYTVDIIQFNILHENTTHNILHENYYTVHENTTPYYTIYQYTTWKHYTVDSTNILHENTTLYYMKTLHCRFNILLEYQYTTWKHYTVDSIYQYTTWKHYCRFSIPILHENTTL